MHCTRSLSGRWIDETTGIRSYAFHSRKVMGLQIHLLEKGCTQLADIIAHISLMFVCVCTQLYDAALGS